MKRSDLRKKIISKCSLCNNDYTHGIRVTTNSCRSCFHKDKSKNRFKNAKRLQQTIVTSVCSTCKEEMTHSLRATSGICRKCHGKERMKELIKKNPSVRSNNGKTTIALLMKKNPNHCSVVGKKAHQMHPDLRKNLNGKLGSRRNQELHPNQAIEKINNPNNNFGKGRRSVIQYYNSQMMRSSWEVEFAKQCDLIGLFWEYEKKFFQLKSGKKYLPDFYLEEFDLWVEVKPKFFQTQEVEDKIKECCDNYVVLDKKDFKSFFGKLKHI